ncbi:MAG: hypothetical protein J7M26_04230 [Armatimonadetes bacterium]|nr:hypothetical protein [Armatimonadota bacterium]
MGRVNIGEALTTSFQVFLKNIGMLVLGGLLVLVLSFCVIIMPPLMVGLYIMCLKAARGQTVEIGDLFAGFSKIVPAYVVVIVIGIAVGILYFIAMLPLMGAFGVSGHQGGDAAANAFGAIAMVMMIVVTIGVILLAPIFGLAFPAVADGMGAMEALTFSFQRGLANWPALFVLSLCIALAQGLVGGITGGLASLLTMPWSALVIAIAYMQVIGETPVVEGATPSLPTQKPPAPTEEPTAPPAEDTSDEPPASE